MPTSEFPTSLGLGLGLFLGFFLWGSLTMLTFL